MYSVSLIFRGTPTTLGLTYRTMEGAEEIRIGLLSAMGLDMVKEICDDYGTIAHIDMKEVSGITMLNLGSEFDRQGEIGMLQAKSHLKAKNIAANDPGMNLLQSMKGGAA